MSVLHIAAWSGEAVVISLQQAIAELVSQPECASGLSMMNE
ncbi:hypothetical protein [Photobacterium alginatilyticum]|nr:hypothetical protein [Photobacterium alginatilyticum]